MALFKIEKGLKANLANNRPNTTEGFCYFTTDDGKFYIDTATAIGTSNRVLLNAGAADKLTVNAGAANKPIYFKNGVPTEGSYELNKTVPSNAKFTDTNTKVTQTVTTSNATYPLLLAPSGQTATTTTTSYFDSGVTLNPSTNTITATTFAGNLSGNATSATQASYVLDYDNNTPTYFGYSTAGMESADWLGAWDATVSGQYRLRAIQPSKLSVGYASNSNKADKLTVNAGAANKPIYFKDGVPTEGSYELNKTVPSNAVFTDTNTKVTQTVTTSNAAYPLLLAPNGQTATTTTTSYFDSGVTLNPSTNTITATTFAGNLSGNATSATQASYVLDYNNNTPTYFGYSTSGMSSADWLGAWDATVSGQYRLRAIQPSKLSVGYASNSDKLDNIDSTGFARRYDLGGFNDFWVGVIGLFPVATANDTGSHYHCSGRITANRMNGLYASYYIDFCMNDLYSTGSQFNVRYNGGGISAFTPCTFLYGGVRYAGFKFFPSNAQCSEITFIGQTNYTPFMVAYYDNNSGVLNSEINNSINTSHAQIHAQEYAGGVYGAVWNDYAEFRICNEEFKPGQVVCENNDDTLSVATERLQPGANIVSDTYGFAIGETDEAKCPIAVSGRVLAYTYEPRKEFKAGEAVCAGPGGTVSRMTREEIKEYPERIIGTVSAVPNYETWGTGNVEVNNRIWIKIK